jgi:hypothetical protein
MQQSVTGLTHGLIQTGHEAAFLTFSVADVIEKVGTTAVRGFAVSHPFHSLGD